MRHAAQYAVEFEFDVEQGAIINHHRVEEILTRALHTLCDSHGLDASARNAKHITVTLVKFQTQYDVNNVKRPVEASQSHDTRAVRPRTMKRL